MNERNGGTDTIRIGEHKSGISPPIGRMGRWAKGSEGVLLQIYFLAQVSPYNKWWSTK